MVAIAYALTRCIKHRSCMRQLIVVGAGGHATSIAETATACGFRISFFVDPKSRAETLLGFPIVKSMSDQLARTRAEVAVAIGDNHGRREKVLQLRDAFPALSFPALVHPSASVSTFAVIGEGSVVLQNAVVGAKVKIGRFAIVNSSANIDHDCLIADFASVAPGALLGGGASLGEGSAVSIGAVVQQGVSIGRGTIVGANSFVNKDLPGLAMAYGTPAKLVRSRTEGESYL